MECTKVRKSFCPWQCAYPLGRKRIIFGNQVGVESPPRKKRIGGGKRDNEGLQTVASIGHVLCIDLSSHRVSPSLRVVIFTPPPWAWSLVFLPHLMRHFSDVCHDERIQHCTQFCHLESNLLYFIHS